MKNAEVGARLRKIRKEMDLTQDKIAKMLGIAVLTWQNYEYGNTNPSTEILFKLCNDTKFNPEWIITGQGSMFKSSVNEMSAPMFETTQNLIRIPEQKKDTLFEDIVSTLAKAIFPLYEEIKTFLLESADFKDESDYNAKLTFKISREGARIFQSTKTDAEIENMISFAIEKEREHIKDLKNILLKKT